MLISLQRVHQLDFNNEIFISRMHGANIKRIQRNFPAGKLWHARTADNPAVTTVPPIKVNANARQLILYLSPHKLLGKPLPLSLSRATQLAHKLQNCRQVRSLIFEVTRHSECMWIRQKSTNRELAISYDSPPKLWHLIVKCRVKSR